MPPLYLHTTLHGSPEARLTESSVEREWTHRVSQVFRAQARHAAAPVQPARGHSGKPSGPVGDCWNITEVKPTSFGHRQGLIVRSFSFVCAHRCLWCLAAAQGAATCCYQTQVHLPARAFFSAIQMCGQRVAS